MMQLNYNTELRTESISSIFYLTVEFRKATKASAREVLEGTNIQKIYNK